MSYAFYDLDAHVKWNQETREMLQELVELIATVERRMDSKITHDVRAARLDEANKSKIEKSPTLLVDTVNARQINVTNLGSSSFDGFARLSWTPDGQRIVYMSEESGNADNDGPVAGP